MLRSLYRRVEGRPKWRKSVLRMAAKSRVTVDGLAFEVYPERNRTERVMWLEGRFPEARSIDLVKAMVAARPMLVLDIGANAGAYAVPLAHAMAEGGEVVALEPNPEMATRLRRNLALNGLEAKVEILPVALGAAEGRATLTIHQTNLGQSSLAAVAKPGESIEVETVPLSALMARAEGRPVLAKVDIEGYEDVALWPSLMGDDPLLPDAILLETAHTEKWAHDIPARLKELGFRISFKGEGNTLFERRTGA